MRILDVAGSEFAARGYHGTSLNSVIETAGISKGAFYYYFDDKADLFGTVLKHVVDTIVVFDTTETESLTAETFWSAMHAMNARSTAYVKEHPWVWEIAKTLHRDPPEELQEMLAEFTHQMTGVMRGYMARGRELGVVRDDVPMGLLIAILRAVDLAIDRWFVDNYESFSPEAVGRLGTILVEMTQNMVAPGPGATRSTAHAEDK